MTTLFSPDSLRRLEKKRGMKGGRERDDVLLPLHSQPSQDAATAAEPATVAFSLGGRGIGHFDWSNFFTVGIFENLHSNYRSLNRMKRL
jgi:hypothetical protein